MEHLMLLYQLPCQVWGCTHIDTRTSTCYGTNSRSGLVCNIVYVGNQTKNQKYDL